MRALTGAEIARLLASIAGRRLKKPLVITAVGTGLRQGELLALRWPDIDLERGTVTVASHAATRHADAGGAEDGAGTPHDRPPGVHADSTP